MRLVLEEYQLEKVYEVFICLTNYKFCYLRGWMRKGKTAISLTTADRFLKGVENPKVLFVTVLNAKSSVQDDYNEIKPCFELTLINYESLHKVIDQRFDL